MMNHGISLLTLFRSGAKYSSRFNTTLGYNTLRLPFNTFRPLDFSNPPVNPVDVKHISFKFEPKRVIGTKQMLCISGPCGRCLHPERF